MLKIGKASISVKLDTGHTTVPFSAPEVTRGKVQKETIVSIKFTSATSESEGKA